MPKETVMVATEECARRVQMFASGLADLCKVHGLRLEIWHGVLWIVDAKGHGPEHPDFPWVADISLPSMRVEMAQIDADDLPEAFATVAAGRLPNGTL